jgi:hypothetical protein
VRNKASSWIADSGRSCSGTPPAARRQGLQGRLYKQTQFRRSGQDLSGRNLQNKPNSRPARYPSVPLSYHSTMLSRGRVGRGQRGGGRGDETRKTNPICSRRTGTWGRGWSQSCKTNPISEGVSSLKGQVRRTKPISRGVSSWKCPVPGKTCETNPICRGGSAVGEGQQTALPVLLGRRFCKTNPISGSRPAGPGVPLYRTKPNLGRIEHLGDGAAGRGQWYKTNPIS